MASPTSPIPVPLGSSNPDPSRFQTLLSTKKIGAHHLFPSTAPRTPKYTVEMHEPFSKHKPSILLHSGPSKTSTVVGLVKLHSQRSMYHTIGIGDPNALLEEGGNRKERMIWERLQRMEKWKYRCYEFEFLGEVYTWRRTEDRWYKHLKDMELRMGREEEGRLVAAWRGCTRINVKRGSFYLERRGDGVSKEEESKFEVVVLLTGLAIIEAYRRRAR